MRPRTRDDETILRAAGLVIARHGPAGVTLALVAAEVGLSPATLVQRFGSKRGLLLAFARHAAASVTLPPGDVVDALVTLSAGATDPGNLAFFQLDLTDADFRRHAADHARRLEEQIRDRIGDPVLARLILLTHNGSLVDAALTGVSRLRDDLRALLETR